MERLEVRPRLGQPLLGTCFLPQECFVPPDPPLPHAVAERCWETNTFCYSYMYLFVAFISMSLFWMYGGAEMEGGGGSFCRHGAGGSWVHGGSWRWQQHAALPGFLWTLLHVLGFLHQLQYSPVLS